MANNNTKRKNITQGSGALCPQIEQIATDTIVPYARNSRTHSDTQVSQIAASIREFGFTNPVLIDANNGIIAGHGRVLAASLLKLATVPCLRLSHLTEAQKRAYVIADNQLALNSGWDDEVLKLELADLKLEDFDLGLLGFDEAAMAGFADPVAEEPTEVDAEPQIDRAEELRKVWGTEQGQMWSLGSHRLLCGDSRDDATVSRLIDGAKINLAFTSPPYASQRKYDESSGFKPIPPDEYVEWWEPIQAIVAEHLAADGSFFVNIKPPAEDLDTHLYVHDLVSAHVRKWGWHFATEFCWERNGVPKSVSRRFKNQFEPVYQFSRGDWKFRPEAVRTPSDDVPMSLGPGSGKTSWSDKQGTRGVIPKNRRPRKNGTSGGAGEEHQGTNWQPGESVGQGLAYPGNRLPSFTSTHEALGHTAAFPVGLPQWFITAYTDAGDTVYEPFCGSGSTLIAAENTGRICYGMEISPAYVAVILQRFQDATGVTPVLVSDV